jgi:hypothetical protein
MISILLVRGGGYVTARQSQHEFVGSLVVLEWGLVVGEQPNRG